MFHDKYNANINISAAPRKIHLNPENKVDSEF